MNSHWLRGAIAGALLTIVGCGGTSVISTPAPQGARKAVVDGSAAGFDKRDFPGVDQMNVWMRESPYVWTGYYLPSPCFTGQSWAGQRAALEAQGWGLAVLYVGQQSPNSAFMSAAAATPTGDAPARNCGRNPLTAAQGELDADDAIAKLSADGFPRGTVIYLDVERADPLPPAMEDYSRGWMRRILARGYLAGVYAHKLNAPALAAVQQSVYAAVADDRMPPFWVVNSVGFALGKRPTESGYPFATIWQNPSDASETWGSATFRVDQNVAVARNPSAPR